VELRTFTLRLCTCCLPITDASTQERQCSGTRAGAASLISALARAGGGVLWRDGGYMWEEAVRACVAAAQLPDACQAARDGYAMALCDLAAAVCHEKLEAALKAETRPAKRAALEKLKADGGKAAAVIALQQVCVCVPVRAGDDAHARKSRLIAS
jgi:hypothetical protein